MTFIFCLIFFAAPAYKCDVPITPPPGKYELHQQVIERPLNEGLVIRNGRRRR